MNDHDFGGWSDADLQDAVDLFQQLANGELPGAMRWLPGSRDLHNSEPLRSHP